MDAFEAIQRLIATQARSAANTEVLARMVENVANRRPQLRLQNMQPLTYSGTISEDIDLIIFEHCIRWLANGQAWDYRDERYATQCKAQLVASFTGPVATWYRDLVVNGLDPPTIDQLLQLVKIEFVPIDLQERLRD